MTEATVQLDGFIPNASSGSDRRRFDGWETKTLTVYGADQTTQIRLAWREGRRVTQQFWLNSFRVIK